MHAQVFGDITSTCTALISTQRINSSTVLETLTETSHTMTVTAPALETSGRVPIYLTCRESEDVVEAFVLYQPAPGVGSITTEGPCEALRECIFLVAISNPPDNVKIVDHVSVSTFGGNFGGSRRAADVGVLVTFIVVSSAELVMRIQTPPALSACSVTCE